MGMRCPSEAQNIDLPASLLAAKSTDFTSISESAEAVISIIDEIGNHRKLCQQFGVTMEELESTTESTATTAYGAYILDMGLQGLCSSYNTTLCLDLVLGDSMKLFMALIACLLGYGEVGLWLKSEASRDGSWVVLHDNPYKAWIDIYSGTHYQEGVKKGLGKSNPSGKPTRSSQGENRAYRNTCSSGSAIRGQTSGMVDCVEAMHDSRKRILGHGYELIMMNV
jgi:thiaminase